MQSYSLHIDFAPSQDTHSKLTKILGIIPEDIESEREPDSWIYRIERSAEDCQEDFINQFMDIIEPHYTELAILGIGRDNILFWFVYGYEHQCSMCFNPYELARIGKAGISLNIDCYDALK